MAGTPIQKLWCLWRTKGPSQCNIHGLVGILQLFWMHRHPICPSASSGQPASPIGSDAVDWMYFPQQDSVRPTRKRSAPCRCTPWYRARDWLSSKQLGLSSHRSRKHHKWQDRRSGQFSYLPQGDLDGGIGEIKESEWEWLFTFWYRQVITSLTGMNKSYLSGMIFAIRSHSQRNAVNVLREWRKSGI